MTAKTTLGIFGLGTVGTGVVTLLSGNPQFDIRAIAVRDRNKPRDIDLSQFEITGDPFKLADDPKIEILVEVAGGVDPAYEVIKRAIANGKHIVTANKELIAKHGPEIFDLANRNNVTIFFEAAVGGGIPLISTLQRGLQANRISRVAGIVNGTTNYILTKMEREKKSFAEALVEAQAAGFAEADPTDDVEGRDVAYKIAILSSLAFQVPIEVEKVYRQGITAISDLDIKLAAEFGYRIKMIGLAQPGDDRQHVTRCARSSDARAAPSPSGRHRRRQQRHLHQRQRGRRDHALRPGRGTFPYRQRGRGRHHQSGQRAETARFRELFPIAHQLAGLRDLSDRRDDQRLLHPTRNRRHSGRDRQSWAMPSASTASASTASCKSTWPTTPRPSCC